MHKLIIPAAVALSLIASTAFAEDSGQHQNEHVPPQFHASSTELHREWHSSTTLPGMWHGTSTKSEHGTSTEREREREHGTSTMSLPPALPGTVTSVGSTSFMMWSPAMNRDSHEQHHATTSITVNVTSSTIFMQGSSTASLANLSAGKHVVVFGTVSSSTKMMMATRVIIQGQSEKKTSKLDKALDHLKKWFGKHGKDSHGDGGQDEGSASSTSAAAVQGGGLSNFLHVLFGWL